LNAVEKLLALVQVKATVLRDSQPQEILNEEVVTGNCLVLESKDLLVTEAALTGETYLVDKLSGVLLTDAGLSQHPIPSICYVNMPNLDYAHFNDKKNMINMKTRILQTPT
jgi:magnesium-transporting ATPase (P-type)